MKISVLDVPRETSNLSDTNHRSSPNNLPTRYFYIRNYIRHLPVSAGRELISGANGHRAMSAPARGRVDKLWIDWR